MPRSINGAAAATGEERQFAVSGLVKTFFFYGTLVDDDIRAVVLGPAMAGSRFGEDRLLGWRTVYVKGRDYPIIVRSAGGAASGILARFPHAGAVQRLIEFEGPEYQVRQFELESGCCASVFAASRKCKPSGRVWTLEQWRRLHKVNFLASFAAGR